MNIETKLPPHNMNMEQSILASILINSDSIDDVQLSPENFYNPAHSVIFRSMLDFQANNQPIDFLSLIEALNSKNELEQVGGAAYLSRLLDCPISPNIEFFSCKVKEKSNLRKLIAIASRIVAESYDSTQNPIDIIENAQHNISEIGSEDTSITDIKSILNINMNRLETLKESKGAMSGIPTGFRQFDNFTSGLQKTDLILIGARPSMGKTTLAMNIVRYAVFNLYPVLIFSLEMSKEQLTYRLTSDIANINGMKFKNGLLNDNEWDKINKANSLLYNKPLHIVDNSGLSIQQILSISRSFKRKHNISLILIDYIQLIKGWNNDGQGSKSEISRSLKLLAKSQNIPVIALSQLSRALEARTSKRPVMSDLREAGALEQDADVITFLYRNEVYETAEEKRSGINKGKSELLIRKNRNGAIGKIDLKFFPEFTRFEDVG